VLVAEYPPKVAVGASKVVPVISVQPFKLPPVVIASPAAKRLLEILTLLVDVQGDVPAAPFAPNCTAPKGADSNMLLLIVIFPLGEFGAAVHPPPAITTFPVPAWSTVLFEIIPLQGSL